MFWIKLNLLLEHFTGQFAFKVWQTMQEAVKYRFAEKLPQAHFYNEPCLETRPVGIEGGGYNQIRPSNKTKCESSCGSFMLIKLSR